MTSGSNSFELIFEGADNVSAHSRLVLSSLLEHACGYQLIELEAALDNIGMPISILNSTTSETLDTLRNDLAAAGAKVLIVRSAEFSGAKFSHDD